MLSVLLIDDDEKLGDVLRDYFAGLNIELHHALNPESGLSKLSNNQHDAVILDVMLPGMDGFEVCRAIRKTNDIPIIMLTARGDVTDRIVGLELGADDYLAKPFDPRELVARIKSNVKRQQGNVTSNTKSAANLPTLVFDGLEIQQAMHEVRVLGKLVELTNREYTLLVLLATHAGNTLSRDEILSALKGTDLELLSRAVDITISRLRAKLQPLKPIKTIHGAGYVFLLVASSESN